jgi:hypothetical protein
MGILDLLFGSKKSVNIEPGIWLQNVRESQWTPIQHRNNPVTHELSAETLYQHNENLIFILREKIQSTQQIKYFGCIQLKDAEEIMVIVERIEDAELNGNDHWSYENYLTHKNTPFLDILFIKLSEEIRTRRYVQEPAYVQHLLLGLEHMIG